MIDVVTDLGSGIRRVLAPNPSMMTGPGTNTYLFGTERVTVLDPGPAIDEHVERIQSICGHIEQIVVTHTHPDHSPGAKRLAGQSGASRLGMPPPGTPHQDQGFVPDTVLADGDRVATEAGDLIAIHTPGHASNHLCYLHEATNTILTGDHVIDGSTVVIDPPDGNMRDYLASLARVKELKPDSLLPGHGERITNPIEVIDWIIEHRLERERKVVAALAAKPGSTLDELVPVVYTDVPSHLYRWAARSLLAHLEKLVEDGRAVLEDQRYTLVS